jgi:superfamily I DNA/RNA helicase
VQAEPGAATIEALRKTLRRLIEEEKVAPFRIAVLSGGTATASQVWRRRRFGNACLENAALHDDGTSRGLAPEDVPDDPDEVLFETIRRFKGMEREVVVLVELPTAGERLDELLYVGLTRATTELVVIAPPELAGPAGVMCSRRTTSTSIPS